MEENMRIRAIERLHKNTHQPLYNGEQTIVNIDDLRIVLYELQKGRVKYRDLELKYEQNLKMCKHFRSELNRQDEIINEMAKFIAGLDTDEEICKNIQCTDGENKRHKNCSDCIIEYFTNKAENVGE